MAVPKIADLFNIQRRFLRSAHLERDFRDPSALDGYVVTAQIQQHLDRIATGLDSKSGQRAWRITGDYGSGKSSFALLLAHLFAGRDSDLPSQLRKSIDLTKVRENRTRLLPVLITGSREPLAVAITRSLLKALEDAFDARSRLTIVEDLRAVLVGPKPQVADDAALGFILEANSELIAKDKADGLLIILDELGKFLEFAALHPDRQDIFLLQQLAEISTRSSREPLFTIGLLHQGFSAYADQLSQSAQKEWEKVAGRFEELLFDQPLDQITHLVGSALNTAEKQYPPGAETRSKSAMRAATGLGWFGVAPPTTSLVNAAASLYPLHPATIPVLVKLFSRFGQNERSLFSFLLSNEPFGLQAFAQQEATSDTFYRIHHLYDYAAASFGHRLSVQSYRNHWNHIDSLVRSFPSQNEAEIAILKTVGLLNLVNAPDLTPSEEAIVLAVGAPAAEDATRAAIQRLHRERHVLYSRGKQGGYCLWSHTSVNLDAAYEAATRAVGHHRKVTAHIKDNLDTRPVVARRHYIQTGNLRHFDVAYCTLAELDKIAPEPAPSADGRILIPLCETQEEVHLATTFARGFKERPETLIGITEPLASFAGLLQELERWTWVQKSIPELKDDRYAGEEVARQLASARQTLEKQIQHYAGLRQTSTTGEMSIRWYSEGKPRNVRSNTEFLALLSDLCDRLYNKAPKVHNELVNRRALSSAAASARMRLVEHMFASSDKEFLGMDPAKKPPEMSIYLSVLLESKLHVQRQGKWTITEPSQNADPCNLLPGLTQLRAILEQQPDTRVPVGRVLDTLRNPPYGIRNGILPLLLVVVLTQYQHEVALYENGTFLSEVGSQEILRLTKAPQTFELQFCRVHGVRRALFDKLLQMLGLGSKLQSRAEILDVVRPLCVFVAELPEYTRLTSRLSLDARAVRDTVLKASEPATLLFKDLPTALDLQPFGPQKASRVSPERTQEFVIRLKAALEELKIAYPLLRDRIRDKITAAFELGKSPTAFQASRDSLSQRCEALLINIRDMDLKAFCLRLLDNQLPEPDWLESVGSYVSNTPPIRWKDEDETAFEEKLKPLVQKLLRVESVNFTQVGRPTSKASFRVALTARDGSERDKVVHLAPEEEQQVKDLEQTLSAVLKPNDRISITAMSRVMWRLLAKPDEQPKR
jgi:hypothetical protein